MHRFLEYALLFIVIVLMQVFFFDALNLSVYVVPLVYVAFIGMLPTNINSGLLLMLGLVTGLTMDFFTGMPGLHTIASLFSAFIRPGIFRLTVGKESAADAGIVRGGNYGFKATLLFYTLLVFAHCTIFFLFESLAWKNIIYILLRTFISGTVTLACVMMLANIYPIKGGVRL